MLGELREDEIVEMLQRNLYLRIGCNDGKKTYIVPISYVYRGDHILCHARDGLKIRIMRKNPAVCIELDEISDFTNWKCIVAMGTYEEITDKKEIDQARKCFSDTTLNLKTNQTSLPPEATTEEEHRVQTPAYYKTIFYKVRLAEITGRFEKSL